MKFRSFDDAVNWGKKFGRDNCRPCDKWEVAEKDNLFMIVIRFKSSGDFVGYAV